MQTKEEEKPSRLAGIIFRANYQQKQPRSQPYTVSHFINQG